MAEDVTHSVAVDDWHEAVAAARDTGHDFFDWLSAVDRTDDEDRPGFDVTCRLLDVRAQGALAGLRLSTRVADGQAVPSVTDVFAGAAWHERETYEMFGIDFVDFRDPSGLGLRPLLLPDGFEGTPLRKSFHLAARAVKAWPGGKEPGEAHESAKSPSRRRVQAPGVPPPEWGPR